MNHIKTKGLNDNKLKTNQESGQKLLNSLINIKAIIAHFNTKIDEYSVQNQIVTLSEEQVLEVVKVNFDCLTLRIQDHLDCFEPYDPTQPEEFVFLMKLLADMIQDYAHDQQAIVDAQIQQNILAEIQNNSKQFSSIRDSVSSTSSLSNSVSVDVSNHLDDNFVNISLTSPTIDRNNSDSGDFKAPF